MERENRKIFETNTSLINEISSSSEMGRRKG
jgi:hypothetical protein